MFEVSFILFRYVILSVTLTQHPEYWNLKFLFYLGMLENQTTVTLWNLIKEYLFLFLIKFLLNIFEEEEKKHIYIIN